MVSTVSVNIKYSTVVSTVSVNISLLVVILITWWSPHMRYFTSTMQDFYVTGIYTRTPAASNSNTGTELGELQITCVSISTGLWVGTCTNCLSVVVIRDHLVVCNHSILRH